MTTFVKWMRKIMTNKLEHCVPQSGRALRTLHLMFVHANSPGRMSILAEGIWRVRDAPQTRQDRTYRT